MKNICKWYEKLTKNSKFDKEKTNKLTKKKQQQQRQEKKKPSYSQRQGQHYDILKKIYMPNLK